MSQPLILLVEDEAPLRRVLTPTLTHQGYQVVAAETGAEARAMARSYNPDLVLLDLGLPDIDGLNVLADFRSWSRRPVVILSARHQEPIKVRALDLGADDYLTKPFGAEELLARIRVALRHAVQQASPEPVFRTGALTVDLARREVSVDGRAVHLTVQEYRLLEALVQRAGKVATHAQLLSDVWGPAGEGQNHYLRIYMGQLRRKLEADPSQPKYFLTEAGVGYRLQVDP